MIVISCTCFEDVIQQFAYPFCVSSLKTFTAWILYVCSLTFSILSHGIVSRRNCSENIDIVLDKYWHIDQLNSGVQSNLQICITIENIFCSFSFVLWVCDYMGFLCFWWVLCECQNCFISCSTVRLGITDTKYKILIL